jgi:hypothetical protein
MPDALHHALNNRTKCVRWVQEHAPDVWREFGPVQNALLKLYLQERHPDLWKAFIKGEVIPKVEQLTLV